MPPSTRSQAKLKPLQPPRSTTSPSIIWLQYEANPRNFPFPLPRADHPSSSTFTVHLPSTHFSSCSPHWSATNMQQLQKHLHLPKHLVHANPYNRVLDQSTLMAEILKHAHGHNITYVTSEDEARSLLQVKSRKERKNTILVFTCYGLADFHPARQNYIYDILTHYCGNFVPSRAEMLWDLAKVHDLQLLDKIAKEEGTWRPVSCYPGREGECPLKGREWSVLKRSNSSCGSHVVIVTPGMRVKAHGKDKSVCDPEVRDKLVEMVGAREKVVKGGKKTNGSAYDDKNEMQSYVSCKNYYQWIHQEYISSLRYHGEFRVFVATTTTQNQRREPYIAHTIHTVPSSKNPPQPGNQVYEELATAAHFANTPFSLDDLHDFVLRTYKALQAEQAPGLESLKVGARLDVGWAPNKTGFFVNEITRWYCAESFPLTLEPGKQDTVMKAWADSFAECFPVRPDVERWAKRKAEGEKERTNVADTRVTKKMKPAERVHSKTHIPDRRICSKIKKPRWEREVEELKLHKPRVAWAGLKGSSTTRSAG